MVSVIIMLVLLQALFLVLLFKEWLDELILKN